MGEALAHGCNGIVLFEANKIQYKCLCQENHNYLESALLPWGVIRVGPRNMAGPGRTFTVEEIWGPASFRLHVPPPTRISPQTASLSKPRQPVTIPIPGPGPVFGSHKELHTRSSMLPGEARNRVDLCSAHDHTHDQCRLRHPKEYSARSNISVHVWYVKPSVSEIPKESRASSTKLTERGSGENGWQRALLQSVCRGGAHERGQMKPAM